MGNISNLGSMFGGSGGGSMTPQLPNQGVVPPNSSNGFGVTGSPISSFGSGQGMVPPQGMPNVPSGQSSSANLGNLPQPPGMGSSMGGSPVGGMMGSK